MVWKQRKGSITQLLNVASREVESWKLIHCDARIVPEQGSTSSLTKWQPPQLGFLKCNIDGATFANKERLGLE